MADVLERATTGRAKCRACGGLIAKGELRFGEEVPNPFSDGLTTLWFHLDCAALRRPDRAKPLLSTEELAAELGPLVDELALGEAHPRLCRIARVERAPSGRAHCRQCKEPIAKDLLRFALEIFDEGRFNPMGFLHVTCGDAYFGAPVSLARLARPVAGLDEATRAELFALLSPTATSVS